jgi:hypothetical protein
LGVLNIINLWRTNPGCQVAWATKFYTVVPNICVFQYGTYIISSLWQLEFRSRSLDVWKFNILSSLQTHLISESCAYLKLRVAYHCPILSLSAGSNGSYVSVTCTVLAPALKSPRTSNVNAVCYETMWSRTVVGCNYTNTNVKFVVGWFENTIIPLFVLTVFFC